MGRDSFVHGYGAVVPHLVIRDVRGAIAFYEKAFGATEAQVMEGPGGSVMHAEILIGTTRIMMAQEFEAWGSKSPLLLGGTPITLHVSVEDVDAAFARAVEAGGQPIMPPSDMFWGDRYAQIADPFGHKWSLAQRIEELTFAEMEERGRAWFANAQPCPEPAAVETVPA